MNRAMAVGHAGLRAAAGEAVAAVRLAVASRAHASPFAIGCANFARSAAEGEEREAGRFRVGRLAGLVAPPAVRVGEGGEAVEERSCDADTAASPDGSGRSIPP